jgi:integrase
MSMPLSIIPTSPEPLLEPSFANAIRAIESSTDVTALQKTHWSCSLRQIARLMERPTECLAARWTAVRIPIAALHHAMAGRREKTLQNHKANVRRALVWFAGERDVAPRGVRLSPEWTQLRDRIVHVGVRSRLSGLMRYCSGKQIAPGDVSETVLDGYMAYRATTTRLSASVAARRQIAKAWNSCADCIDGWPTQRLVEAPPRQLEGPSWDDFPEGLRNNIEVYLASLAKPRRGLKGKRVPACKPSTILTRRRELNTVVKRAARVVPLAELVSLKAVLKPSLVEQVLEGLWQEHGTDPGIFTIDLGWKLLSVGREIGLDQADLAQLDEFRAELERHRKTGMTAKNKALIRQVSNRKVLRSIVGVPDKLMAQARQYQEHAPVKAAVIAQIAVAVAILTFAPVRLGNLARIRLGENLTRPAGMDQPYWLIFPNYDVKNNVDLEFELDQRLTDLIDEYVEGFRPSLIRGSNEPWLFPGDGGGHKRLTALSRQITEKVLDETGVRMTAHQFRHMAAVTYLSVRPGEYETVKRLLGHRDIATATRFYCGLETKQATEIYGDILRRQLELDSEDAW